MSKKIFQIANELSVDYTEILSLCKKLKIKATGVNTALTAAQYKKLKAHWTAKMKDKEVPTPPVTAQPVAPKQPTVVETAKVTPPAKPKKEPKAEVAKPEVKPQPVPAVATKVEAKVDETSTTKDSSTKEPSPKAVSTQPKVVTTSDSKSKETVVQQPKSQSTSSASKEAPAKVKATSAPEEKSGSNKPSPRKEAKVIGTTSGKKEVFVARPTSSGRTTVNFKAMRTGRSISPDQLRARTFRGSNRGERSGGDRSERNSTPRPQRTPEVTTFTPESFMPLPLPSNEPNRGDRRRKTNTARGEEGGDNKRKSQRRRQEVFQQDQLYRYGNSGNSRRSPGGRQRRRMKGRKNSKVVITIPAAHKRIVRVDETISVGQLGQEMGVKTSDLITKLMGLGVMATVNQQIDFDTVSMVVGDYNFEAKNVAFQESTLLSGPVEQEKAEQDPNAKTRAPVVTIMGHVDHGKTTLLDRIREANVASGEAGGITQHIGAYKVDTESGSVVFLDTPGHAAFSAMRARGASVTDLVVLVVAADDGVKPQTIESINHAKAAQVPIIVAVNKIDKVGVDPNRIRQELTAFELVPEEWGGETMFVDISALKGDGIDDLIENLALQAEILELRANPKKQAYGRVVEARVDKGRGTVATVLVQEGTLKKGSYILAGQYFGRVRAMTDHRGKSLKEAGPSTPIEVAGLNGVPSAGEEFYVVKNERDAKRIVSNRQNKAREDKKGANTAVTDPWNTVEKKIQHLIIKADVSGSLEAIRASLEALSTDEVEVKVLASAVGMVTESDVNLAQTADAAIIGFNVGGDPKAKRLAERSDIRIHQYSIIYELLDDIREMMSGLLEPEIIETQVGRVVVRAVFHIQKIGSIAGSFILEGKVTRSNSARILRDGEQIHEGKIQTLKRFKDDVKEVTTGYECGIAVDGYKDIQEGDILEVIEYTEIRRKIEA